MVFDKIKISKNLILKGINISLKKYLSWKIFNYKIFLVLLFFASLIRFYHLGYHSLWIDEAWVANSILEPIIKDMIFYKKWSQSTPFLFLIATRGLVFLFGKSEFVLRFIPATLGAFSVLLIYLLCKKITKNEIVSLLSASLFGFNSVVLKYSQELKQYIGDVFFVLLLFYLTEVYISKNYSRKYLIMLSIASVIAVWFSHPSVFVILAITLRISWNLYNKTKIKSKFLRQNKKEIISLIAYIFLTLSNFLIHFFFIIRHLIKTGLIDYWEKYFISSYNLLHVINFISDGSYKFFTYLFSTNLLFFPYSFKSLLPKIMLILFIIGFVIILIKKKYVMIIYCFSLLILVILASFIKKYPYGGIRVDLFLTPFIFIYTSFAIYHIIFLFKKFKKLTTLIILIIILSFPFSTTTNHFSKPRQKEEMKFVIEFYTKNKLPKDYTYVYCGAEPAFKYYYGIINESRIIKGHKFIESPINYIYELNTTINNKVGHNRFWLIFSHYHSHLYNRMINFTKTKCELINSYEAVGASAYLFSC